MHTNFCNDHNSHAVILVQLHTSLPLYYVSKVVRLIGQKDISLHIMS